MQIKFKSDEKLFSANEEAQARDFLYNTNPMNAKILKNFMASKFKEYVRDERCAQPLEKYQQFEDMVIGVISSRKKDFGLKGVDLNTITMFNNSIPTPYMNKDFRNQIAKLTTSEYKKVVQGLNSEISGSDIEKLQDLNEAKLKTRNLSFAREDRNPFVQFFLWLFGYTKDENNLLDEIEETVNLKGNAVGLEGTNEPTLLTQEDYEKAKKTEKKTERVAFSIYDPDFDDIEDEKVKENKPLKNVRFKLAENVRRLEAVENASILHIAIQEYERRENNFNYSRELLRENYKELVDMAKTIGISKDILTEAKGKENQISFILERSKTKFTKEEIEEYEKTAPKKEEDVKEIQSEKDELLI